MNKSGIGITVTGGNANFGNIVQGNNNSATAGAQSISTPINEAFLALFRELDAHRMQEPQHAEEIDALKADIAALQTAAQANKPTRWGSVAEAAKVLYEKYGWAGSLLKKLFIVLVPGWLP